MDNGKNHLTVFADSDYAEDASRRSRQGTIVMMNGGPVAWASILGKTICCSTAEAEVMAAVSAAKEAVHLKLLLLKELQIDSDHIIIEEDNQACIAQVKGGLRHIRKAQHYSVALKFFSKVNNSQTYLRSHYMKQNLLISETESCIVPETSRIIQMKSKKVKQNTKVLDTTPHMGWISRSRNL